MERITAEQIIGNLREVVSSGMHVGQICQGMGIPEQTYYRWRKEYGGMKTVAHFNSLSITSE
jgi:putative transposase